MKILPLSDIHNTHAIFDYILKNYKEKEYDLVTISGDVWEGKDIRFSNVIIDFQEKIKKPIVMIQGNHDFWNKNIFDHHKNIHLLHNSGLELDGINFFGTPYTNKFGRWNWMLSDDDLYSMWNDIIPNDVDVLLSHGPPYGICDNVRQRKYGHDENSKLGSFALRRIIDERQPRFVLVGHIHSGSRKGNIGNSEIYNVSCLDEDYEFMAFNGAPKIIEVFS